MSKLVLFAFTSLVLFSGFESPAAKMSLTRLSLPKVTRKSCADPLNAGQFLTLDASYVVDDLYLGATKEITGAVVLASGDVLFGFYGNEELRWSWSDQRALVPQFQQDVITDYRGDWIPHPRFQSVELGLQAKGWMIDNSSRWPNPVYLKSDSKIMSAHWLITMRGPLPLFAHNRALTIVRPDRSMHLRYSDHNQEKFKQLISVAVHPKKPILALSRVYDSRFDHEAEVVLFPSNIENEWRAIDTWTPAIWVAKYKRDPGIRQIEFTPDGKSLVVLSRDKGIEIFSKSRGEWRRRRVPSELSTAENFSISRDSKMLAFVYAPDADFFDQVGVIDLDKSSRLRLAQSEDVLLAHLETGTPRPALNSIHVQAISFLGTQSPSLVAAYRFSLKNHAGYQQRILQWKL